MSLKQLLAIWCRGVEERQKLEENVPWSIFAFLSPQVRMGHAFLRYKLPVFTGMGVGLRWVDRYDRIPQVNMFRHSDGGVHKDNKY